MPTKELFSFEQIAFKLSGGGRSNAEIMTSLERYFWRNRFPLKEVFWKPYALVDWVEEGSGDSDPLPRDEPLDRRGAFGILCDIGDQIALDRLDLSEDEQFPSLAAAHHDEFSEKARLRFWPSVCVTQTGLTRWADEHQITLPAPPKPGAPAEKRGPKTQRETIIAAWKKLHAAGDVSPTEKQKAICHKIRKEVIRQKPELMKYEPEIPPKLSDGSILRHTKELRQTSS